MNDTDDTDGTIGCERLDIGKLREKVNTNDRLCDMYAKLCAELLAHLQDISEQYAENVRKMFTTYKDAMALGNFSVALCVCSKNSPDMVMTMGNSKSLAMGITALTNTVIDAAKKAKEQEANEIKGID